jgi:poly(A) polymerase
MQLSQKQHLRLATTLRTAGVGTLTKKLTHEFPKSQIYLVGGFVRDVLLGRATTDIDIVVRGVPAKKLQTFLAHHGNVNLVGRNFGVFKFIPKGEKVSTIDIALPRTEHAFGTGGYRDVNVQSNWRLPIKEDLSRRDFTINALAYDLQTHTLIDSFGGAKDLKQKKIRAVGDPKVRFREDYSRMLRALRFSCQLNFAIEPKTWRALTLLMPRINGKRSGERVIPYEVIAKELLKTFVANPPEALTLFDRAGAVRALMPELLKMKKCPQPKNHHSEGDVWKHTLLALTIVGSARFKKEFGEAADAEVIFGILFHDVAKPLTATKPQYRGDRIRFHGHDEVGAAVTKKIADRLKLSNYKDQRIDVDADRLAHLVRYHLLLLNGDPCDMRATTIERHYLRNPRLGKEVFMVQYADGAATLDAKGQAGLGPYRVMKKRIHALQKGKKRQLPPPLLNGDEVMRILKIKPGVQVGRTLTELREAQLTGKVKERRAATTFIKKLKI